MRCHYEVLDVPRDADNAEIKTSYRKLALKWHPDKNPDRVDEAKEQFQLVQQAYEVLSDPQERTWYDKHREQILRGSNSEFQDNSLDVFPYFTTTCFKGYNDDEKGFYTVYRTVFDKIIEEDMEFMDDKDEFCEIPRFGDSKSDYDEIVGPFYSYWSSYCTKKSYVWLDPYDITETRDRRVVKLIEKENKKVRQKAKKERNEEIRNLVAFVRKRDKRVKEHTKLMEARVLENRQKQEEIRKQKRIERKQELLNESQSQAEWAKFDNVQLELEEIEKNLAQEFGDKFTDSEQDDEDFDNNLYCVACNKVFKTAKAFANHESSKKHKENVEILKETMLEEEEDENEDEIVLEENSEDELIDEELSDDEISIEESKKSKKKKKKGKNVIKLDEEIENIEKEDDILENNGLENELIDGELSEDEISIEESKKAKKKKKKGRNVMKLDEEIEETVQLDVKNEDSDDFDFESTKKQKKKGAKKGKPKIVTSEDIINQETNGIVEPISKNNNKSSKKSNKKHSEQENIDEIDTSHCCVTCKSNFTSKNKLFDHLKKTGHGVYLPKAKKKTGREKN